MGWNWNANGMVILLQKRSFQKGIEMEWNLSGNGIEINRHPALEVKLNGMELKRKGKGMKRLWRTVKLRLNFGNGMEWKWNSRLFLLNFHVEKL